MDKRTWQYPSFLAFTQTFSNSILELHCLYHSLQHKYRVIKQLKADGYHSGSPAWLLSFSIRVAH